MSKPQRRVQELTVSEFRKQISDITNRVMYRGERILLKRQKNKVAALVSTADLALLETMENHRVLKILKERLINIEQESIDFVDQIDSIINEIDRNNTNPEIRVLER